MEYVVPIITALGVLLGAYTAYRRVITSGEDSASARWKELSDGLLQRVRDLEEDRDKNEKELEEQLRLIRNLEKESEEAKQKLALMEEDHRALVEEYQALQNEHKTLKRRFAALGRRVEEYRRNIPTLIEQLLAHGIEPAWIPQNGDEEKEE
jgi:chromosome segregation ATPase